MMSFTSHLTPCPPNSPGLKNRRCCGLIPSLIFFSFLLFHLMGDTRAASSYDTKLNKFEREYNDLYDATDDKAALEAIRDLHSQLDDDNDGNIEPSETGDFIQADLQYKGDRQRQSKFHKKDAEISVIDLWSVWHNSEVYNWTVNNVADWLKYNVELPQYEERFRKLGVDGTQLPKAAVGSSYLTKTLGITNPIHRSKINLKAMDVILFGPPKDQSNFLKDCILTSLLLIAVTGLFYAHRQNKKSQEHLKKMMSDMDSLSKAEQTLMDLQDKLQQKDSKIESLSSTAPVDMSDVEEIRNLREELDILRSELQRAEVELEDKCWVAPPVLQHWLQLTYEIESSAYNAKKKAAEEQLELAKDMCDKLKKKRSSLVGAFVSTHGRSIDDVDRSILEARSSLMELTKDLTERTQRWRQVEMLCGCSIINNPGINVLQSLIRHVGTGRYSSASRAGLPTSKSVSASFDDGDDDTHSIAASHITTASNVSRPVIAAAGSLLSSTLNNQHKRRGDLKSLSRDSSKDTSSSDDLHHIELVTNSNRSSMNRSSPPTSSKTSTTSSISDKRKKQMVKSFSQDAGGSIQEAANALASSSRNSPAVSRGGTETSSMTSSVSESHLQVQHEKELKEQKERKISASTSSSGIGTSASSTTELNSTHNMKSSASKPSILEEKAESVSSNSSSRTDLSTDKQKKPKKGFFNFGKKKEKKNAS